MGLGQSAFSFCRARRWPVQRARSGSLSSKAIAIHPWGKIFISTGGVNLIEVQSAALAKCNADPERRFRDGNCFVYAVNNDVILPERRMVPK
jgi:hypothetical protein